MERNVWQPGKIKNIEIKNRIVRSATNEHLGDKKGLITEDYIELYKKLAQNEVGLIITSHFAVDKNQKADNFQICVQNEENKEKFKELTTIVHGYEAKIFAQISYPGHNGSKIQKVKTPSGIGENTEAIEIDDISKIVENFKQATQILQETGFDGVQLHLAHGFLLSEFLDDFYNKRIDNYGGSVENKYRIIHEILVSIKEITSENFAVTVKLDSVDKEQNKDFINEQIKVCKWLEKDVVDAIEISGSTFKKENKNEPYYLENALKIKEEIQIPIMLVGGFRNLNQMNDALNKGIDFISISRPFLAQHDFVQKLKNEDESICQSCNTCNTCYSIYKTEYKHCVLNKNCVKQLKINYEN